MPPIAFNFGLASSAPMAWHRVDGNTRRTLGDTWRVTMLPTDAAQEPSRAIEVARALGRGFIVVQGEAGALTVARAIAPLSAAERAAAGLPQADALLDFDAHDWWFRTEFSDDGSADASTLVFHGLATIVDIWLNGVWIGRTDNMHLEWEADVSSLLLDTNELVLAARAMTPLLAPRRPRARWRARIVASQEWRWHRTTHIGRMPGFGPATPPVGPWRAVTLEQHAAPRLRDLSLRPHVRGGQATLDIVCAIAADVERATLVCGPVSESLYIESSAGVSELRGSLGSSALALWWPHTHGAPTTYATRLDITLRNGAQMRVDLGHVGFRSVAADTSNDGFGIVLNGHPLFLRGVCWNARDWSRLDLSADELDAEFALLVAAGVNCIRIPGCFTYSSHEFLAACDRHGVLVWHDLMFSVLDYPEYDPAFAAACEREVRQVLTRAQAHPCIATVCGNSEVAQQSAMSGLAPDELGHALFRERLATVAARALPDVPYRPSTPWGGFVPFELGKGTAHYYGVGAYRRELNDAQTSGVRFATECLAFANVPEPESLARHDAEVRRVHGAQWKRRVPRDGGATWDFEDVRDHYASALFRDDMTVLRETEPERYLALGRATSAAVIERTMQSFRRADSPCNGAFLWMWSDPWMGAGWGLTDHDGQPKSAWYALRRASRDVAIALTNEGLDGARVHVWNDSPNAVAGTIVVRLLADSAQEVRSASRPLRVEAHGGTSFLVDELFGCFTDSTYAYRFGEPSHGAVHAAWIAGVHPLRNDVSSPTHRALATRLFGRPVIDDATLFPLGDARPVRDAGLCVEHVEQTDANTLSVIVAATHVTPFVRVGADGYAADDSYFTLTPGLSRLVRLRRVGPRTADGAQATVVHVDAVSSSVAVTASAPTGASANTVAFDGARASHNHTTMASSYRSAGEQP